MSARDEDLVREERQSAAAILQMRVALVLLAEARRRGDFGDPEALAARAAELAEEMGDGVPAPHPDRPALTVSLERPDRIGLSSVTGKHSSIFASLGFDGIIYEAGFSAGVSFEDRIEPEELDEEQREALARLHEESQKRRASGLRFTASRFVRAIAAPPQPRAAVRILAVQLFEDGFYIDSTFDKEPEPADGRDPIAGLLRGGASDVRVADDLGTEYLACDSRSGGVLVCRATHGFAPAVPTDARTLRITTDSGTVELDLQL